MVPLRIRFRIGARYNATAPARLLLELSSWTTCKPRRILRINPCLRSGISVSVTLGRLKPRAAKVVMWNRQDGAIEDVARQTEPACQALLELVPDRAECSLSLMYREALYISQ